MFEKLLIALALCEPRLSTLCSIEGDGGVGGGGGDGAGGGTPPPKTFTQEELNRIAAKQKQEGEAAGRRAAETEAKAKQEELENRIKELELAGKTQQEREAIERKQREEADAKARKAREDALTKERDDAKSLATAAQQRWKNDRVNVAVTSALVTGKALASATADAAHAFVRDSKIDTDDDGQVTSVIYGGKSFTKLEEAAAEFLKDRPHFAQASGTGGAGTRGGGAGGNGTPTGKKLTEMSRQELLELDRQQREASK